MNTKELLLNADSTVQYLPKHGWYKKTLVVVMDLHSAEQQTKGLYCVWCLFCSLKLSVTKLKCEFSLLLRVCSVIVYHIRMPSWEICISWILLTARSKVLFAEEILCLFLCLTP